MECCSLRCSYCSEGMAHTRPVSVCGFLVLFVPFVCVFVFACRAICEDRMVVDPPPKGERWVAAGIPSCESLRKARSTFRKTVLASVTAYYYINHDLRVERIKRARKRDREKTSTYMCEFTHMSTIFRASSPNGLATRLSRLILCER